MQKWESGLKWISLFGKEAHELQHSKENPPDLPSDSRSSLCPPMCVLTIVSLRRGAGTQRKTIVRHNGQLLAGNWHNPENSHFSIVTGMLSKACKEGSGYLRGRVGGQLKILDLFGNCNLFVFAFICSQATGKGELQSLRRKTESLFGWARGDRTKTSSLSDEEIRAVSRQMAEALCALFSGWPPSGGGGVVTQAPVRSH